MGSRKKRRKNKSRKPAVSIPQPRPANRSRRPWVIVTIGVAVAAILIWVLGSRRGQESSPAPSVDQPGTIDVESTPAVALSPQQATKALMKEEYDVARQLVTEFPGQLSLLTLMGDVYEAQGNTVEASRYWERCLDRDRRYAPAHYRLGKLAQDKGEFEEATQRWRKALEIDPDMVGVRGCLGSILLQLGNPEEAIPELEQEFRISPDLYVNIVTLGQAYLQANAYEKAKETYEKAVELQPEYTRSYYGLAKACEKLGESENAEKYRAKFQQLKATSQQSYYRALKTEDDLNITRQRVSGTHTAAGRAYHRSRNLRKAEKHWRKAAELDPKATDCRLGLAALYQLMNRDREYVGVCEQLEAIEPGNATYHLYAGGGHVRLQQFSPAEKAFRKAIQCSPQKPEGYRALAAFYLTTMQNVTEARSLAEAAVRLDPSAANLFLLAQASLGNDDRAKALSSLERAIELEPDNRQIRQFYQNLKVGK